MDNHVDPEIIDMLEQLDSMKALAGKMASKSSETEALIESLYLHNEFLQKENFDLYKFQMEDRALVILISFSVGVIGGLFAAQFLQP